MFGREIRAPFFSKFVVREMINSFRQAKSLLQHSAARKLKDATSSLQFTQVGQNILKTIQYFPKEMYNFFLSLTYI